MPPVPEFGRANSPQFRAPEGCAPWLFSPPSGNVTERRFQPAKERNLRRPAAASAFWREARGYLGLQRGTRREMSVSVRVEVPRQGIAQGLAAALAERGLHAEVVAEGDAVELEVSYATEESERLLGDVSSAIEGWVGDQMLPLVVERANGGCVVRPPAG